MAGYWVLSASAAHILGFVAQDLLVLWFLGFAIVLIHLLTRWRRVSLMKRDSAPGNYSREQELLRRARSLCPTSHAFSSVFTHAAVDPGLVGILRPAILLPVGIAENLTDVELTAILVHELCHLRQRDNLGALFLLHTAERTHSGVNLCSLDSCAASCIVLVRGVFAGGLGAWGRFGYCS
jgi:beta-lactamase regulating signal transducer with metallopeptidase domain